MTTLDPCATADCDDPVATLLGADPFTALRPHFGMLLGVDDFETLDANPRGKLRLHNAWLHGEGVVWGLDVQLNDDVTEVEVFQGLGLDAAGRELYLSGKVCLSLAKWYEAHRPEIADWVASAAKPDKPGDQPADPAGGNAVEHDAGQGAGNDPKPVPAAVAAHPEGAPAQGADGVPISPTPVAVDSVVVPAAKPSFVGHIVIRYSPCLARQVPALADECNGSDTATAYSRVDEGVELLLRVGPAPRRPLWFLRLRLLLGLRRPSQQPGDAERDQEVLDRLDWIATLPPARQRGAMLGAFRDFAAYDVIDRRPGRRPDEEGDLLYPEDDACELVLAEIKGDFHVDGDTVTFTNPRTDVTVRPSHVATRTIQELTLGTGGTGGADAGGPRIDPQAVTIDADGRTIHLPTSRPLAPESVRVDAFSVSAFTNGGWDDVGISKAEAAAGDLGAIVKLTTAQTDLVRLIAHGTGPHPLLGADLVPLAGAVGGPPGSAHEGHDFVWMRRP